MAASKRAPQAAAKAAPKAPRRRKKEHWRRDQPSFYNFYALDRAPLKDAPDSVGGLTGALMSNDLNSGAQTFVVELAPKFRKKLDGKGGALELFTLRSSIHRHA